jgi:hypothetical protein
MAVVHDPGETLAKSWPLLSWLARIGGRLLHDMAAHGTASSGCRCDLAHRSWTTTDLDELLGIDRDRS